jgi:putative DNA primase/helicase
MTRERDTITAAQGRWREILPALGIPAVFLNGKHQACPLCGGKDRARFDDRSHDGDYFCSQCGAGKGLQLVMRFRKWEFKQAADEVDKIVGNLPPAPPVEPKLEATTSPDELNLIWQTARPLDGNDPASRYLIRRGIKVRSLVTNAKALRVTVLPHHPTGTVHPCMVARMCEWGGRPRQIHRTYLTKDGHKADLDPVRMFMPGPLPKGGAISLGGVAEAIGVAEGIETALSASQLYGLPVWATTADSLLMLWRPPPQARQIIIFADNDASYAGQAAAYALAKRLVFEARRDKIERDIAVLAPQPKGQDWNDVLISRHGESPAQPVSDARACHPQGDGAAARGAGLGGVQ